MTTELKAGSKVIFTPTNTEFEIKTVTDKRVSWFTGFEYKSGSGNNTMKTATTSRRIFERGIENGTYIVK